MHDGKLHITAYRLQLYDRPWQMCARTEKRSKEQDQNHRDSKDGIGRFAASPSIPLEPPRIAPPPHMCIENKADRSGNCSPKAVKSLSDRVVSEAARRHARLTSPGRSPHFGPIRRRKVLLDEKGGQWHRQSDRTMPSESVTGQSQRNPIQAESDSNAAAPTHASVSSHDSERPHCQCGGSRKSQSGCREGDSPRYTKRQGGCYTFCLYGGSPGTGCCPVLGSVVSRRSVSERLNKSRIQRVGEARGVIEFMFLT